MRRPVSDGIAVRSQVIDGLESQEIKETGNEAEPLLPRRRRLLRCCKPAMSIAVPNLLMAGGKSI
jgi:hypothetical protein